MFRIVILSSARINFQNDNFPEICLHYDVMILKSDYIVEHRQFHYVAVINKHAILLGTNKRKNIGGGLHKGTDNIRGITETVFIDIFQEQ